MRRILNFFEKIIVIIFIVFSSFCLVLALVSKKTNDDAVTFLNKQARIVITESMESNALNDVSNYEIKSIPVKSFVLVETIDKEKEESFYQALQPGDVLTFNYYVDGRILVITHRLISKESKTNGGYILTLRGDNINADGSTATQIIDTSLGDSSFNQVVGKVVYVNPEIGKFLMFVKSPIGLVLTILIPCLILIGIEIYRVFDTLYEDRNGLLRQRDEEIEDLRRKLGLAQRKQMHNTKRQSN